MEELDRIDMIATNGPNGLELIIVDPGITTDENERMQALVAKLRMYMGYVLSDEFAEKHADIDRNKVSIRVVCQDAPSSTMQQLTEIRSQGDAPVTIPVRFQVLSSLKSQPVLWEHKRGHH